MSQTIQKLFLDTSVQIERILSEPGPLEQLERELASSHVQAVTTFYVWMEFQRTFIDDCVHIYRIMREHQGWAATISHLLDGSRSFRPRAAVRCTKIISRLYHQSYQNWGFARDLLGEQIARGLKDDFWHNVTPLSDPITCDLVRIGVTPQLDGTYTVAAACRKESAACHLPAFLAAQREKVHTIADYLVTHPNAIKGQEQVTQLLTAILTDPRAALGQAACWPLGDLIIALQVPKDAVIWTLDADFVALATALGLRYTNPLIRADGKLE